MYSRICVFWENYSVNLIITWLCLLLLSEFWNFTTTNKTTHVGKWKKILKILALSCLNVEISYWVRRLMNSLHVANNKKSFSFVFFENVSQSTLYLLLKWYWYGRYCGSKITDEQKRRPRTWKKETCWKLRIEKFQLQSTTLFYHFKIQKPT